MRVRAASIVSRMSVTRVRRGVKEVRRVEFQVDRVSERMQLAGKIPVRWSSPSKRLQIFMRLFLEKL